MSTTSVTVTTAATVLVAENFERIGLIFDNQGSQTVFIGDSSGVTTAAGWTLPAGDKFIMDFEGGAYQFFSSSGFWGIVAATTADVRVQEFTRTR